MKIINIMETSATGLIDGEFCRLPGIINLKRGAIARAFKSLLYVAFALISLCSFQPKSLSNGSPADFIIFKGTNLAHFLSHTDLRGVARDTIFRERDIIEIKEMGFDFIRLPIAEEQMWDEKGGRHEDAFRLLKNVLNWCQKHEIKIVVDLHVLRSHDFGNIENPLMIDFNEQEKFYSLWSDLSSALKNYSLSNVAYELLNAPYALDPEQWNNIVARAVAIIRAQEPERILIIGSNLYQSPSTFDDLKVPDDKNLMLSFQFWEPFLLTFYKAGWSEYKNYSGPVHYPGELVTKAEYDVLSVGEQSIVKEYVGVVWNREKMEERMQIALQRAEELGMRIYCAEYGVSAETPEADKLRYYNDLTSVFNRNGIPASIWNYKSDDMGILNGENVKNEAVLQAIMKR